MLALKLIWLFVSVQNYTGCGSLAISNYTVLVTEPIALRYLIIPMNDRLNYVAYYSLPTSISYSSDRFFVLIGNEVRLHDAINGNLIASFTINDSYSGIIKGLNATSFVACGDECGLFIIENGEVKRVWSTNIGKASDASVYGNYLYVADSGWWKVEVINITNGKIIKNITFTEPVASVSACKDLVAASDSSFVYIYNVTSGKAIKTLGPFGNVNKVRFSPSCKYLLVQADDSVYLYYASNFTLALKRCWCPDVLKDVTWYKENAFGDSYVPAFSPYWCNVEIYEIVNQKVHSTTQSQTSTTYYSNEGVSAVFALPIIAVLKRLKRRR